MLLALARVGVAVLGLMLLWRICVLALSLGPFAVRDVRVLGSRHFPREAALEMAGIPADCNIFRLRTRSIRRRLESHPLIERAQIRKRLPGTLDIRVEERRLAAVILRQGEPVFVDSEGRAVECDEGNADGLAELVGVAPGGKSRDSMEGALAALDALAAAGLPCRKMRVAPSGALEATLPGGMFLKLGLPETLSEKAVKARQALAGLDPDNVEYLDVSCPTAIVWKPREGSEKAGW